MKTGSEVEVVSHGDICMCERHELWCSNARALSHSLPPPLTLLISVRSPPSFLFLSPRPNTKLSALWTFLTIYVGQGQDRLNHSASLSPCRWDSAKRRKERRSIPAALWMYPPPSLPAFSLILPNRDSHWAGRESHHYLSPSRQAHHSPQHQWRLKYISGHFSPAPNESHPPINPVAWDF